MGFIDDVLLALGVDTSGIKAGMADLRNQVKQAETEVTKSFANMFSPRALIVAGLEEGIRGVIEYGAKVYDLGKRFDVSTDSIQQWGNAAEKNGASLEAVAMGFNRLIIAQSKANGGNAEMIQHFANLNITVEDLKRLTPDELMLKIGASSLNAADVVALLGRNALQLVPTLKGLANGTIEFGHAIDEINIQRLKEAEDAFKELWEMVKIFGGYIVGPIVAGVHEVRDAFIELKEIGIATWNGILAAAKGDTAEMQKQAQIIMSNLSGDATAARNARKGGRAGAGTGGGTDAGSEVYDEAGNVIGSTGGAARSGGASSSLQSLQEQLAKLQELHILQSLTDQERLANLKNQQVELEKQVAAAEKIDEFGDKAVLDDKEEVTLLQAQLAVAKNQQEIDKLTKQIGDEKKKAEQAIIEARQKQADLADEELKTAQRRNEVLRLTAEGHADIAANLQEQWKIEDQIDDVTERINEAWSEGNQELAEQLTDLRDELQTQKQLTIEAQNTAAAQRAAAAAARDAAQYARSWRDGMQNLAQNLGGYNPLSLALGSKSMLDFIDKINAFEQQHKNWTRDQLDAAEQKMDPGLFDLLQQAKTNAQDASLVGSAQKFVDAANERRSIVDEIAYLTNTAIPEVTRLLANATSFQVAQAIQDRLDDLKSMLEKVKGLTGEVKSATAPSAISEGTVAASGNGGLRIDGPGGSNPTGDSFEQYNGPNIPSVGLMSGLTYSTSLLDRILGRNPAGAKEPWMTPPGTRSSPADGYQFLGGPVPANNSTPSIVSPDVRLLADKQNVATSVLTASLDVLRQIEKKITHPPG